MDDLFKGKEGLILLRTAKVKMKGLAWMTALVKLDDENLIQEIIDIEEVDDVDNCEVIEIKY